MKEKISTIEELANGIQKMMPADDNVKLNMADSYDLIQTMKLSLLIDASRHSGRFVNYLGTLNPIIPLPYPLAECDPGNEYRYGDIKIIFGKMDEELLSQDIKSDHSTKGMIYKRCWDGLNGASPMYENVRGEIQCKYFAKYPSFELLKNVSCYNTFEKASYFFGISSRAFDPITKGLYHISPTIFHSTAHEDKAYWESARKEHPKLREEELIEEDLNLIITRKLGPQCNDLYSKIGENADQKGSNMGCRDEGRNHSILPVPL